MARTISHYTVQYRADASRDPQVCEIADRDRAWAFMREVEAAGGSAGFPNPVWAEAVVHAATVVRAGAGSRQPWRAECPCGWASVSYAADHAAQIMADAHNAEAVA